MVDFPLYNTLKPRFFSRASRAEFLRGALIFLRFSDPENLGVRLLISENQPKRVGVRLLTGGGYSYMPGSVTHAGTAGEAFVNTQSTTLYLLLISSTMPFVFLLPIGR